MAEGGYFSFHSLVSTSIIKAVYFIGALLISCSGVALITSGIVQLQEIQLGGMRWLLPIGNPFTQIISGAVILVLANLLWRVVCEAMILVFSIHELLAGILKELKTRS